MPFGSRACFSARKAAISCRGAVQVQPGPFGRADAVLGADAAAEAGHEAQHGVLDARGRRRAAAPRTFTWRLPSPAWPKRTRRASGAAAASSSRTRGTNPARAGAGQRDVELDRDAGGVDRLGVRLPVAPQAGPARRCRIRRRCPGARRRRLRPRRRPGRRSGRGRRPPRPAGTRRSGASKGGRIPRWSAHQLDAVGEEQLGRLQGAGQAPAEMGEDLEGRLGGGEAEQRDGPGGEAGDQPQPDPGDDAERALASRQAARPGRSRCCPWSGRPGGRRR